MKIQVKNFENHLWDLVLALPFLAAAITIGMVFKAQHEYYQKVEEIIISADPNTEEGRQKLQVVSESLDRMSSSKSQSPPNYDKKQDDYVALKALKIL
jgi:hypothetical protein